MAFYTTNRKDKQTASAGSYDKNTDYSELINHAVQNGDLKSAAKYEQQRNAKIEGEGLDYKPTYDYEQYLDNLPDTAQTPSAQDSAVPKFQSDYDTQLNALYEQIVGRPAFNYDVNDDALYQQYRDNYLAQGKLAMEDTMGQAAALTGGYGSTYAQNAGQQAYNAYLAQLDDIIPELYDRAKSGYDAETDRLLQQYSLAGDLRDREYNAWLGDYERQREADALAYNRAIYADETAYEREKYADETAYARQNDAYDRLVSLITSSGYQPTEQELSDAGMSNSEAQAYRDYYNNSLRGGMGGYDDDEESEEIGLDNYSYAEAEILLEYYYETGGYDAWKSALLGLSGLIPTTDYYKLRQKHEKISGSGSGGSNRITNSTQMPM